MGVGRDLYNEFENIIKRNPQDAYKITNDFIEKANREIRRIQKTKLNLQERYLQQVSRGEHPDVNILRDRLIALDREEKELYSFLEAIGRPDLPPILRQNFAQERKNLINRYSQRKAAAEEPPPQPKSRAEEAGAIAASVIAAVGRRPSAIGAIAFLIFIIIVGPFIWLYYFTNVQLPYATQIRTNTNTIVTQLHSSIKFFGCALKHLDLVFSVTTAGTTQLNKVCGKLQPVETFEQVVTFKATVPAFTSLDIPIIGTFIVDLRQDDKTVEGLTVKPRILDTAGAARGILVDQVCDGIDKNGADKEKLCYQSLPADCFENGCDFDQTRPQREINYLWRFVNASAFKEKYAESGETTRVFPKFDVQYKFRTDTPSKTIIVTKNERDIAPTVSGKKIGPVNVELDFSRDVFVEKFFPEKIETFMKVIVKNNGVGKAKNIDLTLTSIFDSELGEILIKKCAGKKVDIRLKSGDSFKVEGVENVVVFDKRSITTGCFVELPKTVGDSHAIIFTPTIEYTYVHDGSLAIEPSPASVTIDLTTPLAEEKDEATDGTTENGLSIGEGSGESGKDEIIIK